jgi:2,3,4,5-tetrahydropyridine-2-carboxylate N-succinyltransferase
MSTPTMTTDLQSVIDLAWESRAEISAHQRGPVQVREAVDHAIGELNAGRLRVASRNGVGDWMVHQWLKKAVLLSFRLNDNQPIQAGALSSSTRCPPSSATPTTPCCAPAACAWCHPPWPGAAATWARAWC